MKSADWYYLDNGFPSLQAMDGCHGPIFTVARETIGQSIGNVMDLGCGNGVLISRICAGHVGLVPYGVDCDPKCIEHARRLWPKDQSNFIVADLFNSNDL